MLRLRQSRILEDRGDELFFAGGQLAPLVQDQAEIVMCRRGTHRLHQVRGRLIDLPRLRQGNGVMKSNGFVVGSRGQRSLQRRDRLAQTLLLKVILAERIERSP